MIYSQQRLYLSLRCFWKKRKQSSLSKWKDNSWRSKTVYEVYEVSEVNVEGMKSPRRQADQLKRISRSKQVRLSPTITEMSWQLPPLRNFSPRRRFLKKEKNCNRMGIIQQWGLISCGIRCKVGNYSSSWRWWRRMALMAALVLVLVGSCQQRIRMHCMGNRMDQIPVQRKMLMRKN